MNYPFVVSAVVLASNPVQSFASKKDPTRTFKRWEVLVRMESGAVLSVANWDPPPVLPDLSGSPKVNVYFAECERSKDIAGAWKVRGCVQLVQGK